MLNPPRDMRFRHQILRIRSSSPPLSLPSFQSSWGAYSAAAPLSIWPRIGRTFLSDPPRFPGSRCGVWENGTPQCALGRSPGWRSGGRRFCVLGGAWTRPHPCKLRSTSGGVALQINSYLKFLPDNLATPPSSSRTRLVRPGVPPTNKPLEAHQYMFAQRVLV